MKKALATMITMWAAAILSLVAVVQAATRTTVAAALQPAAQPPARSSAPAGPGPGASPGLLLAGTAAQVLPSPWAVSNIPPTMLALYRDAALSCPGLPWPVLAGIGTIETGNGRNVAVSSAGAMGPMQFMPATWRAYGVEVDGDGRPNIMSPVDSVYTAARYLCANGAGRQPLPSGGGGAALGTAGSSGNSPFASASLEKAIYAYNHSRAYVGAVLAVARRCTGPGQVANLSWRP
ncbi:MAG: lytic transglycosylase domain-containing protein [Acidimicrobiales bacterium]